jgi:nucleoid-associated protein YgaU
MYTGVELQNSKKTYGKENIRWKTIGEATQEVDRCCTPGREGAAGCQKMEAGS